MRSSFELFFFAQIPLIHSWYYTWGCTYFWDFRDFWIFLKIFSEKCRAEQTEKANTPTMEGGYDIFLFGVAAGKGICVGRLGSTN